MRIITYCLVICLTIYNNLCYAQSEIVLNDADQNTIKEAVQSLEVNGGSLTLNGIIELTENLIVPSSINLKFGENGLLKVRNSAKVTIKGSLTAGRFQIFEVFNVNGLVSGNDTIQEVYPEWWGAKINDEIDDVSAIQNAITFAKDHSDVVFLNGIYKISNTIETRANLIGKSKTILKCYKKINDWYTWISVKQPISIKNIVLDGKKDDGSFSSATHCINFYFDKKDYKNNKSSIVNCEVKNFNSELQCVGITVVPSKDNAIINIEGCKIKNLLSFSGKPCAGINVFVDYREDEIPEKLSITVRDNIVESINSLKASPDESDGIFVSNLAGLYDQGNTNKVIVEANKVSKCGKRGIKIQFPWAKVINNTCVISDDEESLYSYKDSTYVLKKGNIGIEILQPNVSVINNRIYSNSEKHTSELIRSSAKSATISNNYLYAKKASVHIRLSSQNKSIHKSLTADNNILSNNHLYFHDVSEENQIITMSGVNNVQISNNIIETADAQNHGYYKGLAIGINNSNNIKIDNNSLTKVDQGIILHNSSNVFINSNLFLCKNESIFNLDEYPWEKYEHLSFKGNNFTSILSHVIDLTKLNYADFSGNKLNVVYNSDGFHINNSKKISIKGNEIVEGDHLKYNFAYLHKNFGVFLKNTSQAVIKNNVFRNYAPDEGFGYGIKLEDSTYNQITDNILYGKTFYVDFVSISNELSSSIIKNNNQFIVE